MADPHAAPQSPFAVYWPETTHQGRRPVRRRALQDAGLGTFGRFQQLDRERERRQVLVNVEALFDLVTAFLPAMLSRGTGAILNIGSLAGFQPLPASVT